MTMSRYFTSNCKTCLLILGIHTSPMSLNCILTSSFSSSFTASLSSSVMDYPIEHGRRYQAYQRGCM